MEGKPTQLFAMTVCKKPHPASGGNVAKGFQELFHLVEHHRRGDHRHLAAIAIPARWCGRESQTKRGINSSGFLCESSAGFLQETLKLLTLYDWGSTSHPAHRTPTACQGKKAVAVTGTHGTCHLVSMNYFVR